MEGMATADPLDAQPTAFDGPILGDRLQHILRAGRGIDAAGQKHRGNKFLITLYQ